MFYAVELPWGFPRPKTIVFDAEKKTWFYKGPILPPELRPFQSVEFSRERWHEDEKNGLVSPITPGEAQFTPKPHQLEAAKKIASSYGTGWSAFLLADKTGIGKTLSSLVGLSLISKIEGRNVGKKATVLIVCPKGAIPVWRQTLRNYRMAHPFLRPLILNYEQLQKLLSSPPQARVNPKKSRKARQIARDGLPMISFDYIIFDEAHYLKNYPSSNISLIASRIAGLDKPYRKGTSPFVLFSTATPGSTPLNFSVMAGFVSKLINPKQTKHVGPKEWGDFLIQEGFEVTKGKSGYNWATIPWFGKDSDSPSEKAKYEKGVKEAKAKQRVDAQKIGRALTSKNAPFIMRSPKDIEGWPEQQLIPFPIELKAKEKQYYKDAWTQFRTWLNLTPATKDPKSALVQQLRYRQKTSLLRVDAVAEMAKDWVAEGKQVYISVEFIETVDRLLEAFAKAKISTAEITGRNTAERESERIRFQKGMASIVVSTVVEAISLHAKEILPDGTKATAAERVSVLADIRQNPLNSLQALGRAHRNGENSVAYIPYIEDTVDKKIVDSFINKVENQEVMTGKSLEDASALERIFRLAAAKTTSPAKLSQMEQIPELWAKLIEVQVKPELWMILAAWTIALALTFTPIWRMARNIITVVHEGGHALMAVVWGRRIAGIKLHSDTSGVTISSGKPWGLGVILTTIAGYTAPATLGLFLAYLSSEGRSFLALVLLGISMLLIFLSIRNLWGFIVTVPLTIGFYYLLQVNESVQTFALVTVAAFLTVASTRPIIELQRARHRGQAEESDADQLQKLTLVIPGILWVAFFMLFSLAANIATIWLLSRDLLVGFS